MQRPRRRGETVNGQDHGERHQHQAQGDRQADRGENHNGADIAGDGRQDVPGEQVFHADDGIACRRDPAAQRARQPVGKITGAVSCQIAEEVAAQIGRNPREGHTGHDTAEARKQMIGAQQGDHHGEGKPGIAVRNLGQRIDQELDRVLRAHGADGAGKSGQQDARMQIGPQPDVAQIKQEGPLRVAGEITHRNSLKAGAAGGNRLDRGRR